MSISVRRVRCCCRTRTRSSAAGRTDRLFVLQPVESRRRAAASLVARRAAIRRSNIPGVAPLAYQLAELVSVPVQRGLPPHSWFAGLLERAAKGPMIYVWPEEDNVRAYRYDATAQKFQTRGPSRDDGQSRDAGRFSVRSRPTAAGTGSSGRPSRIRTMPGWRSSAARCGRSAPTRWNCCGAPTGTIRPTTSISPRTSRRPWRMARCTSRRSRTG